MRFGPPFPTNRRIVSPVLAVNARSSVSDPTAPFDVSFDCPALFRGMPDFDLDGDIDLADFGQWQVCATSLVGDQPICDMADINLNGSVELGDFGEFSKFMHGPAMEKFAKDIVAP